MMEETFPSFIGKHATLSRLHDWQNPLLHRTLEPAALFECAPTRIDSRTLPEGSVNKTGVLLTLAKNILRIRSLFKIVARSTYLVGRELGLIIPNAVVEKVRFAQN